MKWNVQSCLCCAGMCTFLSLCSPNSPWCCSWCLPGESIWLHAAKSRSHPSCVDGLALSLTWEMFQITPSGSLQLEELGCNILCVGFDGASALTVGVEPQPKHIMGILLTCHSLSVIPLSWHKGRKELELWFLSAKWTKMFQPLSRGR